MSRFFKTIFTVEILSERHPCDNWQLIDVIEEANIGSFSSRTLDTSVTELSPQAAANALIEHGSTPEFFQLDDDGNHLYETTFDLLVDGELDSSYDNEDEARNAFAAFEECGAEFESLVLNRVNEDGQLLKTLLTVTAQS